MATPEPRPGPTQQGPVRSQGLLRPVEHHPRGVIRQRPERAPESPPQRIIRPGRDLVPEFVLVKAQPDERVGGRRQHLQRPGPLADHADELVCGLDPVPDDGEQLPGTGPGRDPEREQGPVAVRRQGSEHLVEPLVRDRPRDALDGLGLIRCRLPWPLPRLQGIMVRVDLVPGTPGSRERADQRTAVLCPVILIERMDHGTRVPAGRRRVRLGLVRLPRDRVHRSRGRTVTAALPRRLPGPGQPERVIAGFGSRRPVPRDLHRVQEPDPAEELERVRAHRAR